VSRDGAVAMSLGAAVLAQGAILAASAPLRGQATWQALLVAGALAFLTEQAWRHRMRLHHRVDMTLVMLALGGLGMILGSWADAGFGPLAGAAGPSCCHLEGSAHEPILRSVFSWMTALMLLFSVPPGFVLTRCAALARRSVRHGIAMHVFGNVGMVAGMIAAGRLLGGFLGQALGSAPAGHHLAMLGGMLLGMPAAEWLGQALLGLRPWRRG
jgi:hypothetical protein